MHTWIENEKEIDSAEKKDVLKKLYSNSKVALVYGAAGTGKTYLINYHSFWPLRVNCT